MANQLIWGGFDEATRYFAGLGQRVLDAATPVTLLHANITATVLRQVYPLGSEGRIFVGRRRRRAGQRGVPIVPGGLRRGVAVEVRPPSKPNGARTDVVNRAPHAWLYEKGTDGLRHNRRGANRGRMPASNLFVKTTIRQRKTMETDIARVATNEGLTVTVK